MQASFNESTQSYLWIGQRGPNTRDRQLVTRSTSTRLTLTQYRENIVQLHSKGISSCFCHVQTGSNLDIRSQFPSWMSIWWIKLSGTEKKLYNAERACTMGVAICFKERRWKGFGKFWSGWKFFFFFTEKVLNATRYASNEGTTLKFEAFECILPCIKLSVIEYEMHMFRTW